MGFFSNVTFDSLDELFRHQLKDLYDAELRIQKRIPGLSLCKPRFLELLTEL
jgi:ferritin-like metal-binding protein YciE